MIDTHANLQTQAETQLKDWEAHERESEALAAAMAASSLETGSTVSAAVSSIPGSSSVPDAPKAPAASAVAPTAEQERAFGAGGGSYGRAAMPTGKKPASNEKAAAIRKAICSA